MLYVITKTIDYEYDSPQTRVEVFSNYEDALKHLEDTRRDLKGCTDVEFDFSELFGEATLTYFDHLLMAKVYHTIHPVSNIL